MRYNLGGIESLIGFEVDGYLGDDVTVDNKTSTVEELEQALADLNIQDSTKVSATPTAAEVKVIEKGRLVDDNNTLELKSRSLNMCLKMAKYLPQLWISQTRNLFVGRHKDGLMKEQAQKFDMPEYFPAWENKNQDHLKALVGLITEIKEVVRSAKGKKCMLVVKMEEKPRVLRVYERDGKDFFLPRGAREKCWGIGT